MKIDGPALDRYITGNYGEDQFDHAQEAAVERIFNQLEDEIGASDIDWLSPYTGMTESDAHELNRLLEIYGIAEIIRTVTASEGQGDG